MFKRYLAFILLTVLVLMSFVIPTYADSAIGEIGTEEMGPIENDRVPLKDSYTEDEIKSILAGDHNFDIPEEGIKFSAENFPLEVDENVVSPNAMYIEEDDYYITVLSSGEILRSPNSSYVTTISYYETAAYMWVFEEVDMFTYAIRNKADPDRCLAVSQLSSGVYSVITKIYSATDTTCHWSMTMTSDGNYIQSEAVGTDADGQYLYLSGKRFLLNSSKCTYIGLVDVDDFVPCTSLTFKETYYSTYISGKTEALTISGGTPAGANYLGNKYVTYTISDTSVCTLNSSKQLVGASIGSATITATHKMTGATGTVRVHVGYPTKVKAYYDYAFEELCLTYTEFSNIPSAQIEEWFEKVKKKYAEDLDIHLILVSTTLYRSYPETLSSDNRMICDAGETPNVRCTCSTVCENSTSSNLKSLHHKNFDNIFFRLTAPDKTKYLYLYFTGHLTCDPENANSGTSAICGNAPLGSSLKESGYALIAVNENNSNQLNENQIKKTIAHEMLHLFYVPHHYGDGIHNQNDYCIMGDYRTDSEVCQNLTICSVCKNTALGNANMHNHR